MQQFQVPQYIDIEDKIFGPLTVKQFLYVLGGVGSIVVLWLLNMPSIIFWPLAMIIGSFFGSLAFMKINGQPAITVLNNAVGHFLGPKRFIWRKVEKKIERKESIVNLQGYNPPPRLSHSKLKELAWSLDINDKFKR